MKLVRNYYISDSFLQVTYDVTAGVQPFYDDATYAFIFGFTTTYFDTTQNWVSAYKNDPDDFVHPNTSYNSITFFGMSMMTCSDPGEYLDRVGKTCFTSRNSCPAASWFQTLTVQSGSLIKKIIVHESNTLIATLEGDKIQYYKYN